MGVLVHSLAHCASFIACHLLFSLRYLCSAQRLFFVMCGCVTLRYRSTVLVKKVHKKGLFYDVFWHFLAPFFGISSSAYDTFSEVS